MLKKANAVDYNNYTYFLIYGEEDYLVNQTVQEIIPFFLPEELRFFNFYQFNEENCTKEAIGDVLYTMPVMADKKVIHISQIEKIKAEVLNLISFYFTKNYEHTVIIFSGEKPDKRKGFFKDLDKQKKCYSVEFKTKNDRELQPWIKNYIEAKNRKIAPDAIMLVMQSTAGSLSNLSQELDKISTYTQEMLITSDHVAEVLGISKEFNIYKFQNAVANRDLTKSLLICENLMKLKENKTEPIAMNLFLSRLFISALEVSSQMMKQGSSPENAAAALGYNNAWRDADLLLCVKKYSLQELIRIVRYLLEGDLKLKSSYQDKKTAILLTLKKIINHAQDQECRYLENFTDLRI